MNHPLPFKPFYFLRHGETDWNRSHKTMGSQDIPLNDKGIYQAKDVEKLLKNECIHTIISSPLLRARQTANIVQTFLNVPIIEINELREACWGDQEGKSRGDDAWVNDWKNGKEIKGAEKYCDFVNRVKIGLHKALHVKGHILIVSHGIVYQAIQDFLKVPITDIGNCAIIFHEPPSDVNLSWRPISLR